MITITGAAGFIGSALVARLNADGFNDLVLVDDFSARPDKARNHENRTCTARVDRQDFPEWLRANEGQVQFVFHLGARTDTTEQDRGIFDRLNLSYSQEIWRLCHEFGLPMVYASSAATYGGGEHGYSDDHQGIDQLKPLNPYGDSKQQFDLWALKEAEAGNVIKTGGISSRTPADYGCNKTQSDNTTCCCNKKTTVMLALNTKRHKNK